MRFVGEAQLTDQLEHPNIVPIHDFGEDDTGHLFFTMKLVKGRFPAEILLEDVHSLIQLLNSYLKVCDDMSCAHAKGVIHNLGKSYI